jgi:hypothetical protein
MKRLNVMVCEFYERESKTEGRQYLRRYQNKVWEIYVPHEGAWATVQEDDREPLEYERDLYSHTETSHPPYVEGH